jgi:hypothetical protein
MGDIFDSLAPDGDGDIFDRVSGKAGVDPGTIAAGPMTHKKAMGMAFAPAVDMAKKYAQPYIGAAKGALETAYNVGTDLLRVPVSEESDALTREALTPSNGLQQAGKTAEQVGEFFLPGAATAGKLAPLANAARKAGVVGTMAKEGLSAAGVAAAQGGDPLASGATAAAMPAAAKVAEKAAPWMMNTLLGVKPKHLETGANPGKGVIEEGAFGITPKRFMADIKDAQQRVMGRLNGVLKYHSGKTIDATTLLTEPLTKAAGVAQNMPQQKAMLDGLAQQIEGVALSKFAASGSIAKMTPAEVNGLRQYVDEVYVAAKGDPNTPKAVVDALSRVKQSLNGQIDKVANGAKQLNQQYGNLREAERSYRTKLNAEQGHFGKALFGLGIYSPALAAIMTGDYEKAVTRAAAGAALQYGMTSPGVAGGVAQGVGALGRSGGAAPIVGGIVSEATDEE